jgi:hypothetical protein
MNPETRSDPGLWAAMTTSSPVWLVPTATEGLSSKNTLFFAMFGPAGSRNSPTQNQQVDENASRENRKNRNTRN